MFLSWTELMNTCILSIVYLSLLSFLSRFLTGQLGISSPRAHQSTRIRRDVQTDKGMEFLGCGSMPGGYYEEEGDMDEDFTVEVVSTEMEVLEKEQQKCHAVVPGSSDDVGTDVGALDAALIEPTDSTTQPLITTNTLHPAPTSSLRRIITTAHLTSPRPHSSPSFPSSNPRRLSPLASFPATPCLKRTDRIRRRSPALRPSSSCDISSSSSSSPTTSASEHTVSPTSINSPDSSLTPSMSIIRTALDPIPFSSTTPSSSFSVNGQSSHRRVKSFRVRVPDIHNFDDPDPFARESPVGSPALTPTPSIRREGKGKGKGAGMGMDVGMGAGMGMGVDFSEGGGGGKEMERERRRGETFMDMSTEREMGGVVARETTYSFWDDSDVGEAERDAVTGANAGGVGGGSGEKTVTGAGVGAKMGRKVSLRVRENVAEIVSRLKRTASLSSTLGSKRVRDTSVGGRRME